MNVDNYWLIVTVRNVGVLLLAILTITANQTQRHLERAPGRPVSDRPPSPPSHSPGHRGSLPDLFLLLILYGQSFQSPVRPYRSSGNQGR